jgi:hypothetical protein
LRGAIEYASGLGLAPFLRTFRVAVVHPHNTHGFLDGAVGAALAGVTTIIHTDRAQSFPDKCRYMAAERVLSRLAYRVVGVSEQASLNLLQFFRTPERRS